VRTYGQADLDKLVKAYGTGASDDDAFKTAIGISTDAFDKAWPKANEARPWRLSVLSRNRRPGPLGLDEFGSGRVDLASDAGPASTAPLGASASPNTGGTGQSQKGPRRSST